MEEDDILDLDGELGEDTALTDDEETDGKLPGSAPEDEEADIEEIEE